jgi:hypothetical protein
VPRSHPLRLRFDCRQQLTPEEFARVERLLVGSLRTMGGRWWSVGYVARPEIRSGLCVVGAAEDPEQAYVRRCGAELALICDQIPIPLVPPLALRPRLLTTEDIDAIRAYVDPAAAGYQLARRITGLPDGLVALIGGDQITDSAILGCPVPEPVRPILRAVDDRSEPVLQVPDMAAPEPIIDATPPEEEFAVALGRLLQGRKARIRPRKLPPQLRSRFEVLRADGIPRPELRRVPREPHRALQQLHARRAAGRKPLTSNPDKSLPSTRISTDKRSGLNTDRDLSPEERLRRVDALCRQLASIRPVGERR